MKIDPKEWDPPEYLPISSRNFLIDRAQTMHHVQQAAYLTMGQILLQVREKFKNDPKLDGWWCRWVEEATPLSATNAANLIKVAAMAKEIPGYIDACKGLSEHAARILAYLPKKTQKELVEYIRESGNSFTGDQLKDLGSSPEVELAAAEEQVQQLQQTIAEAQLKVALSSPGKERSDANQAKKRVATKLELALQRLSEARQKVNSLERERSTQELVMAQLQAQLRQEQLKVEEMSLDPDAKRKRAIAKTVVDATNGLDLLLASLDKYGVDRDDIGPEHIKVIERKMAQVKAKLLAMSNG